MKRIRELRKYLFVCAVSYRPNVENFHPSFYFEAKLEADEIGSVSERQRTVQRQKHGANVPAESTEEYFTINIPWIFLVLEMETRYCEQHHCGAVVHFLFL